MAKVESDSRLEVATLASGCFWCTEAFFQEIRGVVKVEPELKKGLCCHCWSREVHSR